MKLEDFTRGWIVGDFEPSIVQTKDMEIGILELEAGHKADNHFHAHHTEWNLILSGCARLNKKLYFEGDIFQFLPFEKATVEYLEDTKLLVIKSPATKNDKHYA